MKKLAAFVLVTALAASLLAGCGDKDTDTGTGFVRPATHVKLEVYSQLANAADDQMGFFKTLLEDRFNAEITIVNDAGNKFDTRMANGFLGDIVVFGSNGSQYRQAIQKNMLFAWEDLGILERYGADLSKYFTEALEANRTLNSGFGPEDKYKKIYGIGHGISPNPADHESFFYSWDARWDLYKALGYPRVKNLDDYFQVLGDMRDLCKNPDGTWKSDDGKPVYAMSLWPDWDGNMVMNVKSFASSYYGYDELLFGLYDAGGGVYHDVLEGSGAYGAADNGPYFKALEFFNRLYRAGLLDPDSEAQTWDGMAEKARNGRTLVSTFDFAGNLLYNTRTTYKDDGSVNVQGHLEQGKMMAPLVPEDASVICYGMNPYGGNRVWAIGKQSKHPDRAMQIIDWLATPEGAMSVWYGLRDLHWYYDEGGGTHFTDFGKQCYADTATSQAGKTWVSPYTGDSYPLAGDFDKGRLQINNIIWSLDSINPDSNGEKFHKDYWKSNIEAASFDIERDWRAVTGCDSLQEYLESTNYSIIPAVNYAESRMSAELEADWNAVKEKIKQYTWAAMRAPNDLAYNTSIRNMKRDCENLNYAGCLAYSRQEAANKFGAWDGYE
ncbi:MAG: extracellular solute-binding protein [Clostridiales bacterium]|nr:extracellular solute-binding protein [Clostridiales bacterium]